MPYEECLQVVGVSLASTFFAEGISWLLVYSTDEFAQLRARIERSHRKLGRRRDVCGAPQQKSREKKIERIEETLKSDNRAMQKMRMKSTLAAGIILMLTFAVLSQMLDGMAVAKLPYQPISWVTRLTHRNIAGTNFTDCSVTFIYVLASTGIRPNVQKAFGWSSHRSHD